MADGDARVDGIHIPARQSIRVDPHEHSGLCGCREAELLGGLSDEALFPGFFPGFCVLSAPLTDIRFPVILQSRAGGQATDRKTILPYSTLLGRLHKILGRTTGC